MQREFWAKHGKSQIGPFETREAAIGSMMDRLADKRRPEILKHDIMTGYGTNGPYFDIQWKKSSVVLQELLSELD